MSQSNESEEQLDRRVVIRDSTIGYPKGKLYTEEYHQKAITAAFNAGVDAALEALPAPAEVARWFHHYYELEAPGFGYKTRKESAVPWDEVPENNRKLMEAVSAEVLAGVQDHLKEAKSNIERVRK